MKIGTEETFEFLFQIYESKIYKFILYYLKNKPIILILEIIKIVGFRSEDCKITYIEITSD